MAHFQSWLAVALVAIAATPTGAQQIAVAQDTRTALAQAVQSQCTAMSNAIQTYRSAVNKAKKKAAVSLFASPEVLTGPGTVGSNGAAIEIAKDGSTTGRAQLAWRLSGTTLNVTLKGPLSDGVGDAFSDTGLADGASVAVGAAHTFWTKSTPLADGGLQLAVTQNCPALASAEDRVAMLLMLSDLAPAQRLALQSGMSNATLRAALFDETMTVQRRADLAALTGALSVSQSFTANFSFGRSRDVFRYVTDANPSERQTLTSEGEESTAGFGYARAVTLTHDNVSYMWPQFSAAIGYRGVDALKGAANRQVCTPFGVGSFQCQTVAAAAPSPATVNEIVADIRHWAYSDRVALNLHASHDFESESHMFEARLSYIQFKKSNLPEGLPEFLIDSDALTIGARLGRAWGGKVGSERDDAYFVVYFAASLGAFSF